MNVFLDIWFNKVTRCNTFTRKTKKKGLGGLLRKSGDNLQSDVSKNI